MVRSHIGVGGSKPAPQAGNFLLNDTQMPNPFANHNRFTNVQKNFKMTLTSIIGCKKKSAEISLQKYQTICGQFRRSFFVQSTNELFSE